MSNRKEQSFDGEFDAVIINPEADKVDLIDMITQRLTHLEAMTLITWGSAGESFRQINGDSQSNYMWMVYRTIHETHNLVKALGCQHCKQRD